MNKPKRAAHKPAPAQALPTMSYEAEVIEGLESFATDELRQRFGTRIHIEAQGRGAVRFSFTGQPGMLRTLRTIQAVHSVQQYTVPRPKALLGHQHFSALLRQVNAVRDTAPRQFRTVYLGAAGAETAVMQRLLHEIAAQTQLVPSDEKGDLLIRVRRPSDGSNAWETLVRLTPRPHATRDWRVENYEGALNATVAHVMALLTQPRETDHFLNLLCGSGSLLIERASAAPAAAIIGCDIDPQVLRLAERNIAASKTAATITLCLGDARRLPLRDASIDALCADLPFGQRVGSHEDNLRLYPLVLHEARRIARQGAVFSLITHEIRLMQAALQNSDQWTLVNTIPITLRGLHPRIYILKSR